MTMTTSPHHAPMRGVGALRSDAYLVFACALWSLRVMKTSAFRSQRGAPGCPPQPMLRWTPCGRRRTAQRRRRSVRGVSPCSASYASVTRRAGALTHVWSSDVRMWERDGSGFRLLRVGLDGVALFAGV
jgi:hypothetical protein